MTRISSLTSVLGVMCLLIPFCLNSISQEDQLSDTAHTEQAAQLNITDSVKQYPERHQFAKRKLRERKSAEEIEKMISSRLMKKRKQLLEKSEKNRSHHSGHSGGLYTSSESILSVDNMTSLYHTWGKRPGKRLHADELEEMPEVKKYTATFFYLEEGLAKVIGDRGADFVHEVSEEVNRTFDWSRDVEKNWENRAESWGKSVKETMNPPDTKKEFNPNFPKIEARHEDEDPEKEDDQNMFNQVKTSFEDEVEWDPEFDADPLDGEMELGLEAELQFLGGTEVEWESGDNELSFAWSHNF